MADDKKVSVQSIHSISLGKKPVKLQQFVVRFFSNKKKLLSLVVGT